MTGQLKDNRFPICFMLPRWRDYPIGGYKIVYEYANRLAALGHPVTVAYAYRECYLTYYWLRCLRHPIGYMQQYRDFCKARRNWSAKVTWFDIDKMVKLELAQWYSPRWARTFSADTRFVATAMWTSMCLDRFPVRHKGYLIQDRENWGKWTMADVERTYRFSRMSKIAISRWLVDGVEAVGGEAHYVPNGLDFDTFGLDIPIENRNRFEVAVMWHYDDRKRTTDLLAALQIVKSRYPMLHVTAFCAQEQKEALPAWIDFIHCPDKVKHRQIYNKAAIFASASEQEGWGLTPCEAMQCGAAVALTDIGGHRSFAKDGETALMSPPRNPQALGDNICRLIEDDALRTRIARAGHDNIQQFTWDRAVGGFLDALT